MSDELKRAMGRVLDGMGKTAHARRARRFAKRSPEESAPEGVETMHANQAPSPVRDAVDLAMTPEEMDELMKQ